MSIVHEEHCECGNYEAKSESNTECKNCDALDDDICIGPGLDDDEYDKK